MGPQFVDILWQKPLFLIRKQKRFGPAPDQCSFPPRHTSGGAEAAEPKGEPVPVFSLAYYYIVDGKVYQAPDLASVLNARVLSALHNVRESFQLGLSLSLSPFQEAFSHQQFDQFAPSKEQKLASEERAEYLRAQ